jgi:hypothetical protein
MSNRKEFYDPNLSFTDRQLRYAGGVALITIPLIVQPTTMGLWTLLILSSIPLITTALVGWDPIYALIGKSTYIDGKEDIRQQYWTCANVGITDRVIRLVIGIGLIISLLTMDSMNAGLAISFLAIPLITTAIIAWDPLYAVFKVNSFASYIDVKAAEPENVLLLAKCYTFPQQYSKK